MKLTQREVGALRKLIRGQKEVIQNAHRIGTDIVLERLRKYISIPIAIGIFSVYVYSYYFGYRELFKQILEWIIAATIFAMILATLGKKRK